MTDFSERVKDLPFLGIGISTEYGAAETPGSLEPEELRQARPNYASFLEMGVETRKGLDAAAEAWLHKGLPCTYHFLDLNLSEPEDFDAAWMAQAAALAEHMKPAWLCGDAGLWHFGHREPAQMLLLPPILTDESASALAEGIVRLRDSLGYEVLPENPPGVAYIGDLHLLDFFARVCDRADTGMLLDCAHLAIYQRLHEHPPMTGLDGFPMERVIEVHVAGAEIREHQGFEYVEDDHSMAVLPETWLLLDQVTAQAKELRAVVLECERNSLDEAIAGFQLLEARLEDTAFGRKRARGLP